MDNFFSLSITTENIKMKIFLSYLFITKNNRQGTAYVVAALKA